MVLEICVVINSFVAVAFYWNNFYVLKLNSQISRILNDRNMRLSDFGCDETRLWNQVTLCRLSVSLTPTNHKKKKMKMKTVRPHSRTFRCGFLDPSSLPLHLLLKLHVDIEHEFIQSAQGYRFRRFGLRKGILFKRSYKSGVLWYKNLKTWNRRIKKALESIKSLIKCNNMTLPRLQIFFLFFFFLFFLKNARS